MNRRLLTIGAMLFLVGCGGDEFKAGGSTSPDGGANQDAQGDVVSGVALKISPAKATFKWTPGNEDGVVKSFTIENTGGKATSGEVLVKIEENETHQFSLRPGGTNCKQGLEPGSQCQVQVTFLPLAIDGVSPDAHAVLSASSDSVFAKAELIGKAGGGDPDQCLFADPPNANFGDSPLGVQPRKRIKITNTCPTDTQPLHITQPVGSNSPVIFAVTKNDCENKRLTAATGSCEFEVQATVPKQGVAAALYSTMFTVSDGQDATVDVEATINVKTTPHPVGGLVITSDGHTFDFGAWPNHGPESTMVFTIMNLSQNQSDPIEVEPLQATLGAPFTIANDTSKDYCGGKQLGPLGRCFVSVSYTPRQMPQALADKTDLLITVGDATTPESKHRISLRGKTSNHDVDTILAPGDKLYHYFNDTSVSQGSAEYTFTVQNIGGHFSGSLDITAPNNFMIVDESCKDQSLQSGEECFVTVKFVPHTLGWKEGVIKVYDTTVPASPPTAYLWVGGIALN